ncbi:UNVERIFIED_CONTAM: hypothetical protein HDU68_009560 [Siphonaria sp. JEL0065]|nr:hypothetical protein HDU68_009560 [Siphonaria sp. JEL0065]
MVKFQMRDLNLPKTIKLKKDFGEIKESFETAHKFLSDTIRVAGLRVNTSIASKVDGMDGKLDRILENRLSFCCVHKYPLSIRVVDYEHACPLPFEVEEHFSAKDLIELITKQEKLKRNVNLFHREIPLQPESPLRRVKLYDRYPLKDKLATVSNSVLTPIFEYSTFVEITVYEDGDTKGVTIRLTQLTLKSLKKKIEEYFESLQDTRYTIGGAAPYQSSKTPLVKKKQIQEFIVNQYNLYTQRAEPTISSSNNKN